MGDADGAPLVLDLVQTPQEELAESSRLLDLSEDWLGQLHAQTVATAVPAKLELAAHDLGERSVASRHRTLGWARGDVGGNLASLIEHHEIKPRELRRQGPGLADPGFFLKLVHNYANPHCVGPLFAAAGMLV